jgi:hypothetical protein
MGGFKQIRLGKFDELSNLSKGDKIVYFFVYDTPAEEYENAVLGRINQLAFESLVKFQIKDSGGLFESYAPPPEYPAFGYWWNGVRGYLWSEQITREPEKIEEMVERARSRRQQHLDSQKKS